MVNSDIAKVANPSLRIDVANSPNMSSYRLITCQLSIILQSHISLILNNNCNFHFNNFNHIT